MPSVIAQIKAMPPRLQIKVCCAVAVCTLLMGALILSDWRVYEPPNPERIVQVEGKLTSDAQSWRQDRTLVEFVVTPGPFQADRQVVHAYKDVYQSTGLRSGATVSLDVEQTADGALVRKLTTLEGRVLFDTNMQQYVETTGNNAVLRGVALTVIVVTLLLGNAFVTWRRHLKSDQGVKAAH